MIGDGIVVLLFFFLLQQMTPGRRVQADTKDLLRSLGAHTPVSGWVHWSTTIVRLSAGQDVITSTADAHELRRKAPVFAALLSSRKWYECLVNMQIGALKTDEWCSGLDCRICISAS
jgi:hypothetical protein